MASSAMDASYSRPGSSRCGRSWLVRCVRLKTCVVTSRDAPPGATSSSRAATSASGRSLAKRSVSRGWPRISSFSGSGAEVKHSDWPSAARWSGAKSLGWLSPHQAPASAPQSWAPRMVRRPPSAPCAAAASGSASPPPAVSRSTPSASSRSGRGSMRGDGHTSSAAQRPGTSSIHGDGGA